MPSMGCSIPWPYPALEQTLGLVGTVTTLNYLNAVPPPCFFSSTHRDHLRSASSAAQGPCNHWGYHGMRASPIGVNLAVTCAAQSSVHLSNLVLFTPKTLVMLRTPPPRHRRHSSRCSMLARRSCAGRTVVLKSTCAAGAGFNAAPIVINEQKVVGSRCGPFEVALELLASSSAGLDVEKYISGDGVMPLYLSLSSEGEGGVLVMYDRCKSTSL